MVLGKLFNLLMSVFHLRNRGNAIHPTYLWSSKEICCKKALKKYRKLYGAVCILAVSQESFPIKDFWFESRRPYVWGSFYFSLRLINQVSSERHLLKGERVTVGGMFSPICVCWYTMFLFLGRCTHGAENDFGFVGFWKKSDYEIGSFSIHVKINLRLEITC